jgi:hypothetical protein
MSITTKKTPDGSLRRPAGGGNGFATPAVGVGANDAGGEESWPRCGSRTVRNGSRPRSPRPVRHQRWWWEATHGWVLGGRHAGLHLAHPLEVKMFTYRRVANDERDAGDLADLLRMGRSPESWIAPPEIWRLRELVRYRHELVGIRTSCKDQTTPRCPSSESSCRWPMCSARPAPPCSISCTARAVYRPGCIAACDRRGEF